MEARASGAPPGDKSPAAFRTISEAAAELGVAPHVLRFWETRFHQVKPLKRARGRRYYRPEDVALLRGIRDLLHGDGYSIRGVQKLLREGGLKARLRAAPPPEEPAARPDEAAASGLPDGKRAELARLLGELEELRDLLKA